MIWYVHASSQAGRFSARVRQPLRGEDPPFRAGRAGRPRERDHHRQVREAQGAAGPARAQGHAPPAQARQREGQGLDRRGLRRAAAARGPAVVYRRIRVRLLLDTNALVRWHLEKLRPAAVRTVRRAELVAVSAISAWEIAIKRALGKLKFADPVEQVVTENGFVALAVTVRPGDLLRDLPLHHADPFDRLLIVQALA